MKLPTRKSNRLPNYNYSENGSYFITVCTAEKSCILWDSNHHEVSSYDDVNLSPAGKLVDAALRAIPEHYSGVQLEKYVVMPNHIHLLLQINTVGAITNRPPSSVSQIIKQMKSAVTKQLGYSIWQKSYHDHVIRNRQDYLEVWQYIENNPKKWTLDEMYV